MPELFFNTLAPSTTNQQRTAITNNNTTATQNAPAQPVQATTIQANTQSVPTSSTTVQPTTVATPQSSTINRGATSKLAHTSIMGALKKKEEAQIAEKEKLSNINEANSFSQEDLIRAWNKYLTNITDKRILKTTMESCKPTIGENNVLDLFVDNSYQEKEIDNESVSILNFLRAELRNGNITIKISIKEGTEVRSLTPHQRLKKMMEANTNLAEMKEWMGLELEL